MYLPEIQPESSGSKTGMKKINSYKSNVFLAIITYLPKIQSEARCSKIGMIKINSYKSNVFLKSNYHIFTIIISSANPSYTLIRASLSVTMWSDQSGKIGVPTFS